MMKKLITLILINAFFTFYIKSQTRLEVMTVTNYIIDMGVSAHDGDGNFPYPKYMIQLEGKPAIDKVMNKVILYFYGPSDDRSKFKPLFDERTKTATAYYPNTGFLNFYELLKHNKNTITATFRDTPSLQEKEIKLQVYGKVPLVR